ncbi:localization factor PodJL [Methylobacterium phyllostachyos]|uniref:Localization factor PodJL n=1 Tax=Methylobacterium phyllostachyos TaxID=582672 RepID=A0A1G9UYN9_9HYPH|nr:SEL1-like repeat protein [Methylobacterium phyllostachyos]SDM65121.1 localization factor PodJL [Methylobacterium phyllostachyos]
MTRTAMPQLDSFDPEVLDAARDVAARAGVPLETWIASVVPQSQSGAPGNRRQRRRLRAEQLDRPTARPESALRPEVIADRPEARQAAVPADGIPAVRPTPIAETYNDGIAALMDRLDGIDRALDADRREALIAESQRLAQIEARIEHALKAAPVHQVTERLSDIERRMSQLGEQVASKRQLGRRTRPAAADIRNAVQDIRQRQQELSQDVPGDAASRAAADGGVVASMRLDLARRLEARTEDGTATSAALSELQLETVRLRQAIDQLATSRDIGALEQAVTALTSGLERARVGTDLTAIAAPIEEIRLQIERLAEEVADNVHARVAEDVRRLAERLDDVAATGPTDPEGQTLAALFAELDAIRQLITALADPERIQSLANSLQVVSAQVAQLQRLGAGSDLRPLLEEIRGEVKIAAPAVLAEQIETLAEKVDHLCARQGLSEAVDAVAQPQPGEMASIQAMLHTLAEKVDEAGERDGLDALEKQVMTLADRLDTPHGGDPALAGLERTMGDLIAQVAALRDAAPSEAVVERAARNAVAQTLSGAGIAADSGEIGLLRASLADMQARQAASDQRLGATLEGVQTALERLLVRLGPSETVDPRAPSLGERLMSSTSPEVALAAADMNPSGRPVRAEAPVLAADLLEPGSGRPARAPRGDRGAASRRSAQDPQAESARVRLPVEPGAEGDIKTSFIAAARRAAQAAQAELAAEAPTDRRDTRAAKPASPEAAGEPGRLSQLRSEMDRRRRPLLLGLAAIILALGALQTVKLRAPVEPRPVVAAGQAAPTNSEVAGDPTKVAAGSQTEGVAKDAAKDAAKDVAKVAGAEGWKDAPGAKPLVTDPTTTQALPNPVPAEAHAGAVKAPLPQVAGMNTLQADLGSVPPGLAAVKSAALEGDGTAVWDLATREADGRGMPRNLAVAAKLFEKLASAGYAPAQYKIAGQYEKGAGVVRDLDKAKQWYGRAAEQGHARSMHNLAVIFAENPAANGKPDFASAASWFRQGAEFGVRDSQYNLGVLYARGMGLTQDLVQSYAWFAAAAGQGDDDAAKKRDDVANKLSTTELARAKSLAASFKPRKIDAAVNEPPSPKAGATAPMSLLGAPAPSPVAFTGGPKRS